MKIYRQNVAMHTVRNTVIVIYPVMVINHIKSNGLMRKWQLFD